MTEREMEEIIWNYPDKCLNESLTQFSRQQRSSIGRSDLVFTDRLGRLLVIEIKKGKLGRDGIGQVVDYLGMMKKQFPDKPVELMLVANEIPEERKLACEQYNIEWREIPEKRFRDIAAEVGYEFASEVAASRGLAQPRSEPVIPRPRSGTGTTYELDSIFDRVELERLVSTFESVVRRDIDRSLATKLRRELLDRESPSLTRATVVQLAKWCNTTNPLYADGMDVAKKISLLLFRRQLDRKDFGA